MHELMMLLHAMLILQNLFFLEIRSAGAKLEFIGGALLPALPGVVPCSPGGWVFIVHL